MFYVLKSFKTSSNLVIFVNINGIIPIELNYTMKIFGGEHGGFVKYVAIVLAVVFFILLIKPGNNLINWVRAAIEISRQEKQIEMYENEMKKTQERVRMLRTDRDTLEKYAREQFHMAAPGEDIYVLED